MRLFNNTKFDDDFVMDFVKPHYFKAKEMIKDPNQFIESIEVCDASQSTFKITIFGVDCVILETEERLLMKYSIYDWAGNELYMHGQFETFEDAWEYILGELTDRLGLAEENYQEYQVIGKKTGCFK